MAPGCSNRREFFAPVALFKRVKFGQRCFGAGRLVYRLERCGQALAAIGNGNQNILAAAGFKIAMPALQTPYIVRWYSTVPVEELNSFPRKASNVI